ncbi:hypothetical protein DUI87_07720 [Hirundo rustica rustica]|uniref:Clusterin-like protein 1 n=1 Tax=Hirundo rustica rustica TaxID=333673 RepID=A0A3M0KR15_HIRRU|nr:hypothetical protein DUI87_07720 [Hirundo rustica rustica]
MAVNICYQSFPNGPQHQEHSPESIRNSAVVWEIMKTKQRGAVYHVNVARPGINLDLLAPYLVISPLDIFLFSFENVDSLLERKIYKHYTFHLMNSVRNHIPSLSKSITISEDLAPNGGEQINVPDSSASHQVSVIYVRPRQRNRPSTICSWDMRDNVGGTREKAERKVHYFLNSELSEVGEKYVDEEVKKALIGIKQMKIMMERNEDKHIDLMKTLKKSSEEKQQALQLMDEVKARLEEEERQCQVALKNLWNECESCLESTCMRYYTTCKHGASTFKRKVEDFLRKIPPLIFTFHEEQGRDIQSNEKPEKEDTQLVKMEDLFSQLLSDVGTIFDRSFTFFKHMQKEFDQSFQTYFMSDLDLSESPSMPALPEVTTRIDGSQRGWRMPGFLQTVFDFSRTVLEGVTEVITDVFDEYRDYRRDVPEQTKGKC